MVHGRAAFKLEAAKFSLYIGLPIMATVFVNDPANVRWMIDYFKYIKYPPSAISDDEEPLVDRINREFKKRAEEKKAIEEYRDQVQKLDDLENERKSRLVESQQSSKGIWSWFGFGK